ncbi:hypothetical protein NEAUS07_0657 [Nematocida ausubeli]|nr:hypothetical protein NEAUS07_0657 [Nematocida ausubeli]
MHGRKALVTFAFAFIIRIHMILCVEEVDIDKKILNNLPNTNSTEEPFFLKINNSLTADVNDVLVNQKHIDKTPFLIHVTNVSKKLFAAVDKMRTENLSKPCIAYIDTPSKIISGTWKKKLRNTITLRGVAMLSNKVIVKHKNGKDQLVDLCGVPEEKVIVIENETAADTSEKVDVASDIKKKSLYVANSPYSLPDGLYVLYAGASLHINVDIKNKAIHKMYIRAVKESPERDTTGLCKRGPYSRRMYEAFAEVSTMNIALSITDTDIFQIKHGKLFVQSGGIEMEVDRKTMSIQIHAHTHAFYPLGLVKEVKKKWMFKECLNKFRVNHPLLKYDSSEMVYLYNRPRRHLVELFEPHTRSKQSPLKRVMISGIWHPSGLGMVSNRFLLELAAYQDLFVRADAYNHWDITSPRGINYFLAQLYLLESGQTSKAKAMYPEGSFSTPGVEIQNKFPAIAPLVRSGYPRIFMHLPWEFSHIPHAWTEPIRKASSVQILVPSEFAQKVHMRADISKKRIHIIPHGVAYKSQRNMWLLEKNQSSMSIKSLFNAPDDYVRFVMISGYLKRKGIDIGIRAYTKAFKHSDKVVLRVHCAYGDRPVSNYLKTLIQENKRRRGPKIIYTEGYMSDKKIRGLLMHAHYNIAPYRGEGFGMNILDGAAHGAVPIVTKTQPATEFCSKKGTFFIRCKPCTVTGLPIRKYLTHYTMFGALIKKPPTWYNPSEKHLVKLLQKAAKIAYSPEYTKMKNASVESASKQTWTSVISQLRNLLFSKEVSKLRKS